MHRSVFKGGKNQEYKINQVLGDNFKRFVSAMQGSKNLGDFTYGALGQKDMPSGANPKDIAYSFSEYLMAVAAAFRYIENPDVEKMNISGKYADTVSRMYDELISGETTGFSSVKKEAFEYDQLPYHELGKAKHLVPGLHYFPTTDKIFADYDDSKKSVSIVNAIKYLYHYIALLDLDSLTVSDIMPLLETDNLGFMKHVGNVVENLKAKYYNINRTFKDNENTTAVLENGVINGLKAIAQHIISDFKRMDRTNQSLKLDIDKFMDTHADGAAAKNALTEATGDLVEKAFNAWLVIEGGNLSEMGTNAVAATGDADRSKQYNRNGLFNPGYLDKSKVLDKVDTAITNDTSLMRGGGETAKRRKPKIRPGGSGEVASLPFLYGPPSGDATATPPTLEYHLITEGKQGDQVNNAWFVKGSNKDLVDTLVKALAEHGSNTIEDNGIRIAMITRLMNKIEGKDETNLGNKIVENLKKAFTVFVRVRSIPKSVEKMLQDYRDIFVADFVEATYRDLASDEEGVGVIGDPREVSNKSTNLTNSEVWDFYVSAVAKDPTFYSQFFNLVGPDGGGDLKLDSLVEMPENIRKDFRLNVRKAVGWSRLRNGQYGGQKFGDIVFIKFIPPYVDDGSTDNLWLTRTVMVNKNNLVGEDAIRRIFTDVYNTDSNEVEVDVYGNRINLVDNARNVTTTIGFMAFDKEYFMNLLRRVGSESPVDLAPAWQEGEIEISNYMLREGNAWERQGNKFVKVDKNGKEVDYNLADSCQFIKTSTQKCLAFLETCIPASNGGNRESYNTFCSKLLDFDFDVNPPMISLKEQVQKINPEIAYMILNSLRFGSYLDKEESEPVPGFRRYKVQSVGSWLQELFTGEPKNRCEGKEPTPATEGFPCGPLREQLGELAPKIIAMAKNPEKKNFFNYLDVLVHWVNANPQILNPEELVGQELGSQPGVYPKVQDSYNTYKYVNPYHKTKLHIKGLTCGLERLKVNIMNDLSGVNADLTISTIAKVPTTLQMPLTRFGFEEQMPLGAMRMPIMLGGGDEIQIQVDNLSQTYGYKLFEEIYRDLENTMASLSGSQRMKITEKTRATIKEKLDKLRFAEEDLRKSLKKLIERNRLYQASRGHVDSYVDNDNQYAAILSKHSNLLNLSNDYNRRAVKVIDIMQTISNALLQKLGETETKSSASSYERPMSMNYHYSAKKN